MARLAKISLEDKKPLVKAFENEENLGMLTEQLSIRPKTGSARSIIYRSKEM